MLSPHRQCPGGVWKDVLIARLGPGEGESTRREPHVREFDITGKPMRNWAANLVGNERKGLAYGWYNFAIGIATLPSSLIFGALYQFVGPVVAFG